MCNKLVQPILAWYKVPIMQAIPNMNYNCNKSFVLWFQEKTIAFQPYHVLYTETLESKVSEEIEGDNRGNEMDSEKGGDIHTYM